MFNYVNIVDFIIFEDNCDDIRIISYKFNIEFAFQTEIEKRVPSREPSPQKKIITEEIREKSVERAHKESGPPLAPEFTIPLHDATVQEGEKFTFQCNLVGQPTPEVIWYKDGISILNNPDYLTTYIHGICTLTIEETFAEDSAKYTCKAFNIAGSAETSATLTVKGDFASFNISFHEKLNVYLNVTFDNRESYYRF